jgi:DNA-binding CsgD family transcriptional regulator
MSDEAALLPIIDRIYEAAAAPAALEGLAPELAGRFGTDRALVYTVIKPGAVNKDLLSATDYFDDWAHTTYTAYYRQRDELSRRAVGKALPLVTTSRELIAPDVFERTEVYNDYFRRIGAFHMLAGLFPVEGDLLGVISLQRPRTGAEFGDEEKHRLNLLMPHLQRAVRIRHRLQASEQDRTLTAEVLERLALGAIIVDTNSRLVFANSVARRLLQTGAGLSVSQGRLVAKGVERGARLDQLIHDATGQAISLSAGGLSVIGRPNGRSLSLLVSPFRPPETAGVFGMPTALILFSDPGAATHIPDHVLARVLGLAQAEARLLAALVAGQTMAEYAESAGVTINTAKTQLKQIFLKTGHNRQADVIRAVLADPLIKLAASELPHA